LNKNRLEAFSDGVLAIIITIMVLEIKVPEGNSQFSALLPLIPVAISYLLSYLFVGIYWGNHHHLLHSVKQVSSGLIWANLNLLFWLSLIPFSTAWMGENNFAPNTVVLYGIILLLCGVSFTILQKAVERHSHDTEALKKAFKILGQKGIISTIGYCSSIPIAYVNPYISEGIFLLVAILWLVPDKNIEKAIKNMQEF
jgi:uncharacterized membrane protein